ncbi:Retrovirus-related Pol polyprotein from transposon TNT 1-94 [Bienertia sinuspersici]
MAFGIFKKRRTTDKDNTNPVTLSTPKSEFHPAFSVTNICNDIPLVLDREKVQYSTWVELFQTHCHAYDVLDHIDPLTPRPKDVSDSLWNRLDSVVKKWIYGTITDDLLCTILHKGSTAQDTLNRLKAIFQDNKNTRVVYLENQFYSLHYSQFYDISSYYQKLKALKDELANLVLRLVAGFINTEYDTVAAMIQLTDPLPPFETARSKLLLEETRRTNNQIAANLSYSS